jgi:preprotein translocase subunit SecB
MNKSPGYTTGQVSGMTQIPYMSLYRYVRNFGKFFSLEVQKKTRGRRWTDNDIILALSIQSLYYRRIGRDKIQESLAEGWRLDTRPAEDFEVHNAFSNLFEVCMTYQTQAKADRETAHALTLQVEKFYKKATLNEDEFLKLQKAVFALIKNVDILFSQKRSLITINRK